MTSTRIKYLISKIIKPKGRLTFIDSIVTNGKVLDVGCGNNSPYTTKTLRPDVYYVGLDIEIYNQTTDYNKYADRFILTDPEIFHKKIEEFQGEFDAIICVHNLEHCNDYMATTLAMIKALKKSGKIFIATPCEQSIHFPIRRATLNFYDDMTHKKPIPYSILIGTLKQNNMNIVFASNRYRPFIPFVIGLICEPFCRLLNRQAPLGGTWALYGFETIIIAERK